jgi:hypothetical protein
MLRRSRGGTSSTRGDAEEDASLNFEELDIDPGKREV